MNRLVMVLAAAVGTPAVALAAPQGCPHVREALAPLPGMMAELAAGEPLTIVALGSSSTEGAGASAPSASYPSRLEVALRRALPGSAVRVVNAGKSGETSADMLARLETDVLPHAPDLVIWQASGNEVLRDADPGAFLALMREGIRRLRAAGAEVVLMDNQRAPRIEQRPLAAAFDGAMRTLAESERVPLFARSRLMRAWAAEGLLAPEVLAPDQLHHNDRGYACLAEALSAALLRAVGAGGAQIAVGAGGAQIAER